MFLKSLDVVGFKSFAEPTSIVFHPGITSIVGPNGCGKSNVLDSIRWVLGEQSAKALRGGSMQDVIFHGTDSRKPLAMAEVSLTFSDCEKFLGSEFHEVKITRRVFRDGQSEYELNKTPCRLKDIQQLFMDTGIGRTAYSIMEQGKIDAILLSKPEDRRAIFEEAAGITKFKTQRKEALRKLELTDTNLLRMQDIIREVSRQINSLQRQAAKARRYRELADKLKEVEIRVGSRQYHLLSGDLDGQQKKLETLQSDFAALESQLTSQEAARQQTLAGQLELDALIRANEQERQKLEADTASARQRIEFNRSRIQELTAMVEKTERDSAGAQEKARIQEERLATIEAEGNTLQETRQQEEDSLAQVQQQAQELKAQTASLQSQRQQLDTAIAEGNKRLEAARGRMASLEAAHRAYLVRAEKLREDRFSWETLRVEVESAGQSVYQRESEKQAQLSAVEATFQSETEEGKVLEGAVSEARSARETSRTHRADIQARLEALKRIVASQTGVSESAKNLLSSRRGNGVMSSLLEAINVEPGYELAVETSLGRLSEGLVLDGTTSASDLIASLNSPGRVVILDPATQAVPSAPSMWSDKAVLHRIKAEGNLANFLSQALADYYLVEDAAEAEVLRSKLPWAIFVSRQGEIWHRDGWQVRGKDEDAHHSILTRKNEIAQLSETFAAAETDWQQREEALELALATLSTQSQKIANTKAERDRLSAELSAIRYEIEAHRRRDADVKARYVALEREQEQLSEQDTSTGEEQQNLEDECRRILEANQQGAATIADIIQRTAHLNEASETKTQEVLDLRVKVSSTAQRLGSLSQERENVRYRLKELEEFTTQCLRDMEQYRVKIEESRAVITEAESLIQTNIADVERLTLESTGLLEKREAFVASIREIEGILAQLRKRALDIQTERSNFEVSIAEIKMKLGSLADRMRVAYQMELFDLPTPIDEPPTDVVEGQGAPVPPLPIDWETLEKEALEMRTKLESMGPVNLEAITEYEELEQRHKFLLEQEKDLTTSKEQLVDSIRQINETTKVMFQETFQKVQENFGKIFVELFGGGRATLNLIDESDPLESGIEIIAKPPGKQPQIISLLSGGEKTMTAVALLFSIYMVKPSPFCVLDEMDAPLDESNIGRFIQMLQRFVQQSQFVVITHNKKTIAAADVLYGVTMEDHGVSKIVSVKLNRREESPLFNGKEKTESAPVEAEPTSTPLAEAPAESTVLEEEVGENSAVAPSEDISSNAEEVSEPVEESTETPAEPDSEEKKDL